jgi:hypothetical protein
MGEGFEALEFSLHSESGRPMNRYNQNTCALLCKHPKLRDVGGDGLHASILAGDRSRSHRGMCGGWCGGYRLRSRGRVLFGNVGGGPGNNVVVAEIVCAVVATLIICLLEESLLSAEVERLGVGRNSLCNPFSELPSLL